MNLVKEYIAKAKKLIEDHPVKAALVGVVAGFILGLVV